MSSAQIVNWQVAPSSRYVLTKKNGDPTKKGFQGMFLGPTGDVFGMRSFPTHHMSPWKHGPTAYQTLFV